MAKTNKRNKPKHVSIYYDQILYDLDFMPDNYAGIILKMIVWYAAGTEEGKQRIEEMKKRIATFPDKGWLIGIYKRLFNCIDEDFNTYAEICEKRRQAIEKRWKENGRSIQKNTNVYKSIQENTNVYQTDTDTNVSKETDIKDNINIDVVDVNTRMREENFIDSEINSWHNADIVTHDNIPDLTAKWIEEIQLLVRRFNQKELTTDEVYSYYEDFKAQEATETLQTTYSDWRKHFGNFIRKRIKRQEDERDSKAAQDYNSPEARAKRQEGYARVMQKLIAEGQQPKKDDKLPF